MKCRVLMAVILTALSGIFLPARAQKNYYVVVGAFSTEGKAQEFTTHLPTVGSDTAYGVSTPENVIQLYVYRTSSEEAAIARSSELQETIDGAAELGEADFESITISNLPEGRSISAKQRFESRPAFAYDAAGSKTSASTSSTSAPAKPNAGMFKFTVSNSEGESLPGEIHFVDFEREKELASYPTFHYTDILNPGDQEGMALVCGVFGYKFAEKYFDTSNPAMIEGAFQDETGAWVIPYTLQRLEKGDVSVMYNVSFHKDAAIMNPGSKTDLDELVAMMKENPRYEITVHGHCNEKGQRKLLALSNSKLNYFDIEGSTHLFGSAKMLSSLRADAVKTYLINNGIEEDRIKTFAWGSRYRLVDEDSPNAKMNDRIEIEIRKD